MLKTIEYRTISIDKIEAPPDYVRRRVEEDRPLAESVEELGIILPIVVYQDDDKYKLVVGRRRLETLRRQGQKEVEARIIEKVDDMAAKIISVVENEVRRGLPFKDTVTVCQFLYQKYKDLPKAQRIRKVTEDLHLPPTDVLKYLKFALCPAELLQMVEEGKLTPREGEIATLSAFEGTRFDKKKAIRIAEAIAKGELTPEQTRGLLDVSRDYPGASAKKMIAQAKALRTRLVIFVSRTILEALDRAAQEHQVDRKDMAKSALESWLASKGYYEQ